MVKIQKTAISVLHHLSRPLEELEKAAQVFVVCVKLASVEKLLAE